jgi:hypothetical protein
MPPNLLSRIGPREKFGLILALFCVVFLIVDNLVIRPMIVRYEALDLDTETQIATRAWQLAVIAMGPAVDQQFDDIREKLGPAAPAAEAIVQMKREIDALAENTDVILHGIKHREPGEREFYDEYFVDIDDFETNERGLLRFLHGLRTLPGTFQVANLRLAPGTEGARIRGSMTITKVMMPYDGSSPQG